MNRKILWGVGIATVVVCLGFVGKEIYDFFTTKSAMPPHIELDGVIYWQDGEAGEYASLPEGYVEIEDTIYVNDAYPYAAFKYEQKLDAYELYRTDELCDTYVMVNGKLYCNSKGYSNYVKELPDDEGDCSCIGKIQEYVPYAIPSVDFQTNASLLKGNSVYMNQEGDVIYVIEGYHENVDYIKLELIVED